MIVLDASAIADWLLQTPELGPAVAERMRGERLPHTLDFAAVEVISALRRKLAHGELGAPRAERALSELAAARLRRHPVSPLAARIWQLRDQHSPTMPPTSRWPRRSMPASSRPMDGLPGRTGTAPRSSTRLGADGRGSPADHGAQLLSADRRARRAYDALGVRVTYLAV